jgi:hypothetical protein
VSCEPIQAAPSEVRVVDGPYEPQAGKQIGHGFQESLTGAGSWRFPCWAASIATPAARHDAWIGFVASTALVHLPIAVDRAGDDGPVTGQTSRSNGPACAGLKNDPNAQVSVVLGCATATAK